MIIDVFAMRRIAGDDDRHLAQSSRLEEGRWTRVGDHDARATHVLGHFGRREEVYRTASPRILGRDAPLKQDLVSLRELPRRADEPVEGLVVGADRDEDHKMGPSKIAFG